MSQVGNPPHHPQNDAILFAIPAGYKEPQNLWNGKCEGEEKNLAQSPAR